MSCMSSVIFPRLAHACSKPMFKSISVVETVKGQRLKTPNWLRTFLGSVDNLILTILLHRFLGIVILPKCTIAGFCRSMSSRGTFIVSYPGVLKRHGSSLFAFYVELCCHCRPCYPERIGDCYYELSRAFYCESVSPF